MRLLLYSMEFSDFISNKKIFHADHELLRDEAIQELLDKQTDYDMIAYTGLKKIMLINIDALQIDHANNYYYEYDIDDQCDIITDFHIADSPHIKLSIIVGSYQYESSEILLTAAPYSRFKLRITFTTVPDAFKEIRIHYTKHLCTADLVKQLAYSTLLTKSMVYSNGICIKRELTKYGR